MMIRPTLAVFAAVLCWADAATAQTEPAPRSDPPPRSGDAAPSEPLPLEEMDLPPEIRERLKGVKLTPELRELLARAQQASAEMTPRALTPTGEPAQIASGVVALEAPVLTIPVRHAHTGELKQAVQPRGMFRTSKAIPAGTRVFALPMSSLRTGEQLIWCAPWVGAVPGRRAGETVCFPKDLNPMPGSWMTSGRPPYRWVGANGWGLLPTDLRFDPNGPGNAASDVIIDEKPLDFGPMRVVYRVAKAEAGALTVAATVEGEGGSSALGSRRLRLDDGAARLRVHDGELLLTPSADGRQVTVATVTPLTLTAKP